MKIMQLSVFLENRKGRLYDVCSLLGDNNINILALTIAETENFGVLRIVVNKPEEALRLLKEKSFAADIANVVIVEVADKPGGLASVLKVLNDSNINIEYMHAMVTRKEHHALMVFRFDDPDSAITVLQKNGIAIVGKKDILV